LYKQIVVTGIGVVSPLGTGVAHSWKRLMNGESGIVDITKLHPQYKDKTKSQIAGLVPIGEAEGCFNENDGLISFADLKRMGKYQKYAVHATNEALKDAGWINLSKEQKEYTGVSIGNGIGSLDIMENKSIAICKLEAEAKVLSSYGPFFIPSVLPSLAAGSVSIQFGLKGPNRSVNTACASGLYSIEDGASMIKLGDSKVVVAGSTESTICFCALGGFDAMTALCRNYNDAPEKGSRPYDKNRCGFVLAEGCGILILEEMEHAIARGARIYAEYMGCGMTADAYHISAPSGKGSEDAMRIALKKAI
jgi:3-oxoacyl-[acyl-carrier-protein] synthase II